MIAVVERYPQTAQPHGPAAPHLDELIDEDTLVEVGTPWFVGAATRAPEAPTTRQGPRPSYQAPGTPPPLPLGAQVIDDEPVWEDLDALIASWDA